MTMHSSLSFALFSFTAAAEAEDFVFSTTFFLSDSESEQDEIEEEEMSGKTFDFSSLDFALSIGFFNFFADDDNEGFGEEEVLLDEGFAYLGLRIG